MCRQAQVEQTLSLRYCGTVTHPKTFCEVLSRRALPLQRRAEGAALPPTAPAAATPRNNVVLRFRCDEAENDRVDDAQPAEGRGRQPPPNPALTREVLARIKNRWEKKPETAAELQARIIDAKEEEAKALKLLDEELEVRVRHASRSPSALPSIPSEYQGPWYPPGLVGRDGHSFMAILHAAKERSIQANHASRSPPRNAPSPIQPSFNQGHDLSTAPSGSAAASKPSPAFKPPWYSPAGMPTKPYLTGIFSGLNNLQ